MSHLVPGLVTASAEQANSFLTNTTSPTPTDVQDTHSSHSEHSAHARTHASDKLSPADSSLSTTTTTTTTTTSTTNISNTQRKNLKTEYKSNFTPFDQYVYNEVTDSFVKHSPAAQNNLLVVDSTAGGARLSAANSQQDLPSIGHSDSAAARAGSAVSPALELAAFEPTYGAQHLYDVTKEPWYKEVVRRNEKAHEYRFKSEVGHNSPLLREPISNFDDDDSAAKRSPLVARTLACDQSTASGADAILTGVSPVPNDELSSKRSFRFSPQDYKRDHMIATMADNNNFKLPRESPSSAPRSSTATHSTSRRPNATVGSVRVELARNAARSPAQVRAKSQTARQPFKTTASARPEPATKSNQTTPVKVPRPTTASKAPIASTRSAAKPRTAFTTTSKQSAGEARPRTTGTTFSSSPKPNPSAVARRTTTTSPIASRLTPNGSRLATSNKTVIASGSTTTSRPMTASANAAARPKTTSTQSPATRRVLPSSRPQPAKNVSATGVRASHETTQSTSTSSARNNSISSNRTQARESVGSVTNNPAAVKSIKTKALAEKTLADANSNLAETKPIEQEPQSARPDILTADEPQIEKTSDQDLLNECSYKDEAQTGPSYFDKNPNTLLEMAGHTAQETNIAAEIRRAEEAINSNESSPALGLSTPSELLQENTELSRDIRALSAVESERQKSELHESKEENQVEPVNLSESIGWTANGVTSAEDHYDSSERDCSTVYYNQQNQNNDDGPYSIMPATFDSNESNESFGQEREESSRRMPATVPESLIVDDRENLDVQQAPVLEETQDTDGTPVNQPPKHSNDIEVLQVKSSESEFVLNPNEGVFESRDPNNEDENASQQVLIEPQGGQPKNQKDDAPYVDEAVVNREPDLLDYSFDGMGAAQNLVAKTLIVTNDHIDELDDDFEIIEPERELIAEHAALSESITEHGAVESDLDQMSELRISSDIQLAKLQDHTAPETDVDQNSHQLPTKLVNQDSGSTDNESVRGQQPSSGLIRPPDLADKGNQQSAPSDELDNTTSAAEVPYVRSGQKADETTDESVDLHGFKSELLMNVADLVDAESHKREEMIRKSELARQHSNSRSSLGFPQNTEILLSADQLSELHQKPRDSDNISLAKHEETFDDKAEKDIEASELGSASADPPEALLEFASDNVCGQNTHDVVAVCDESVLDFGARVADESDREPQQSDFSDNTKHEHENLHDLLNTDNGELMGQTSGPTTQEFGDRISDVFQHQLEGNTTPSQNDLKNDDLKQEPDEPSKPESPEKADITGEGLISASSQSQLAEQMENPVPEENIEDLEMDADEAERLKLSNHLTNSDDDVILEPRNTKSATVEEFTLHNETSGSRYNEGAGLGIVSRDEHVDGVGSAELAGGLSAEIAAPTVAENRVELATSMIPEIAPAAAYVHPHPSSAMLLTRAPAADDDDDDEDLSLNSNVDPISVAATMSPSSSVAEEMLRLSRQASNASTGGITPKLIEELTSGKSAAAAAGNSDAANKVDTCGRNSRRSSTTNGEGSDPEAQTHTSTPQVQPIEATTISPQAAGAESFAGAGDRGHQETVSCLLHDDKSKINNNDDGFERGQFEGLAESGKHLLVANEQTQEKSEVSGGDSDRDIRLASEKSLPDSDVAPAGQQ